MKITTIADALKCASKINAGKSCTPAEMRATIKLLDAGLKTSRRTVRELKRQLTRSDGLIAKLMTKIGL